jgi:heavy metal sensor kinase
MRNLPLRLRLTAWYSAVLLLGLALFGLAMWLALQQRLIAGVDARLAQRAQGVRSILSRPELRDRDRLRRELSELASESPDGSLVHLRDESGAWLAPLPDRRIFATGYASNAAGAVYRTAENGGRLFRVFTERVEDAAGRFDLLVAYPLEEVGAVMSDFRRLLFLTVPGVLLLACLGGYWLSLRALRPVDAMTSVAKSITVQNLAQRIPVPRTGDELQRMAETWNEALERLDGAVNRIRQFTADASHELRTPLALIRATSELALRRSREPEEYRKYLQSIESEAEHMTALTESLLTLARADSSRFEVTLAPTDLSELARSAVQQNETLAVGKGIRLSAETNGAPVIANADASAIRRLLLILIDNALKHTPGGGTVAVSAVRQNGAAVLSVTDTGEGISAEALPHIFERFYRSDPARGGGLGFGLGLSIAQAIARAHGSRITVESSPDAGARFTISLKT